MLILKPAAARSLAPARLSENIFEAATAADSLELLYQTPLAKIAQIATRRALDHIDGEF